MNYNNYINSLVIPLQINLKVLIYNLIVLNLKWEKNQEVDPIGKNAVIPEIGKLKSNKKKLQSGQICLHKIWTKHIYKAN